MGVTQRPGDDLFFGNTAVSLLSQCQGPIMLIASERARQIEPSNDLERDLKSEKAHVDENKVAV